MNRLTVDREKCTGCGACSERCGFKQVIRVDETGRASFREDRSECIECFHCLMICPNGAVSFSDEGTVTVTGVDTSTSTVLTRRSCRVYENRELDTEVLAGVIRDANMAPRAYVGFTDRKYIVLGGEKLGELRSFLLRKIGRHAGLFRMLARIPFLPKGMKADIRNLSWCFTRTTEANRSGEQLFQGAPAVVMVTGPVRSSLSQVNSDYALMQLLILAEERGLGTCVSGYIQGYGKAISSFLGLPKGERVFCGTMIGYPAGKFPRYVRRTDTVITRL